MKKILFFLLLFIIIGKVEAKYIPLYTYSEFSPDYPVGYDERFIDEEERCLWYKDIVDSQTGENTRETTTEYYSELDGYTKIDESCKPFYRYITSEYVYIDGKGRIVENIEYCIKDYCAMLYINRVEEEEEIVNPKTGDSTYIYLNILFISSILFIGIKLYENKKSV